MLRFSLREGDYFMVGGNIRVTFTRINEFGQASVSVEAPREVPVLRGAVYEDQVAQQAAEGDTEAQVLYLELAAQRNARKRENLRRKSSRAEHKRRVLAGEIKASQ